MRNKITADMIRESYKVAKQVLDNELIHSEAVDDLHKRCKLKRACATDLINNLKYMYLGKRYTRTNSELTTRYYLKMLHRDYGLDALRRAISAVEQHLTY